MSDTSGVEYAFPIIDEGQRAVEEIGTYIDQCYELIDDLLTNEEMPDNISNVLTDVRSKLEEAQHEHQCFDIEPARKVAEDLRNHGSDLDDQLRDMTEERDEYYDKSAELEDEVDRLKEEVKELEQQLEEEEL